MSFEYLIARRYLRAKRKQVFISLTTVLSIAGVAVGVMALIVVIAVMSGASTDFKARILGVESHIVLMRHGGFVLDYYDVMNSVKEIDGVKAVSPFVYSQIMLRSSSRVSGAVLRGIEPELSGHVIKGMTKQDLINKLPQKDKSLASSFEPGIILGKALAENLALSQGDMVYLISPQGMLSPIGHMPSMKRFKLTGIFESGMYEYDSSLAYIHIADSQKLLHMKDSVTGIGIWVDDIYNTGVISEQIKTKLGHACWTRDWMQMNHSLFAALQLEKTAMFIILTLIILVAAFNIASSLIMMVMEKTKDIAILKAMGATNKSIRKIFVFNGMVIGFIGTFIGLVAGVTICIVLKHYKFIELPEAYPFSTLPIQLEFPDIFLIATAAMIICFIATLYPAYHASKLNPVEAIRYG